MKWIELFAGGGGVGCGLEQAGHTVAVAIEMEQGAATCYQVNHPDTQVIVSDVRDVHLSSLPSDITALWASPPCKQHSQARNKALTPREDASIGLAILPYITRIQPELVMIENVKHYRAHPSFTTLVTFLVKRHYTISMRILDAADYGVPQHRERLILQARRGPLAWPTQATYPISSWHEALADMIEDIPLSTLAPWQQALWKPHYNALIPLMIDSNYEYCHRGDGERQLRIIPHHLPAPTVTASHNSAQKRIVLADGIVRRLTPQASARLQTFPDTYQWPTSTTAASTIIGNAVPPLLVQKLAQSYTHYRENEGVA